MDDKQEEFWDDLLAFIDERRVVPIIGSDLSVLQDGQTLRDHLANRLAERLDLRGGLPPGRVTLNDVVCAHVARRGRREDIYPKLRSLMREIEVPTPPALAALARIEDFDLFVTLGFDRLLVDAIDAERHGSEPLTAHIGYSPQRPLDLPALRAGHEGPTVYALLGKLSAAPDYVITDEDLLEFISGLQSEARRPERLFDTLQSRHLLFIGCGLEDWLARFFIRIAKNRPLSMQRGEGEYLIDHRIESDRRLVLFLEHFSYSTRIVPMEGAAFAVELERRWRARRRPLSPASGEPRADVDHAQPGSRIFLSYSRDDSAAAERLYRRLDALGLDVWFDRDRLDGGDAYEQKIRRQVRSCALFIFVASRRAEQRVEGFFRKEWRLAEERMRGIADHVPFVLPIAVDDVSSRSDGFPEAFRRVHWTRAPDGVLPPEFESHVVQLVRDHGRRAQGLA